MSSDVVVVGSNLDWVRVVAVKVPDCVCSATIIFLGPKMMSITSAAEEIGEPQTVVNEKIPLKVSHGIS